MDYIAFAKHFFSATGLPSNLLLNGHPVYSSIAEMLSFTPQEYWPLYEPTRNPEFSSISPDLEYGHVRIEGTGYDLFIGPVFTVPANERLIMEYFEELKLPSRYREPLSEILYHIPAGGHAQLIRYLIFLHFCLNHKEISAEEFYAEDDHAKNDRRRKHLEAAVDAVENEAFHDSYSFERQLYHYIAEGRPDRLKTFLETASNLPREGKMAQTPLRQAKNIFIGAVSKAVVLGAIPGGMDPERAYRLAELYVQECERLQTIKEVHRLQYICLMDLCRKNEEFRKPKGISDEIDRCIAYIRSHTNEMIGIEEVAAQIGRSSSYLMRRFKEETGTQTGAFITQCKLEDACELLTYSRRSLAEISAYLGYSSQSYFQNVFKKRYGITPMQYRKAHKFIG